MLQVLFKAASFTCPLCTIYSTQTWTVSLENNGNQVRPFVELAWATCLSCNGRTIWYKERLVAPCSTSAPVPNSDMPEDILVDFEEARDIAERSPRSAAGLLRLCIQKLCIQFGGTGANLNEDIGVLVAQGLPVTIQQALDAVRIVGNSQLHPQSDGIDLRGDPKQASLLFILVNLIVEFRISVPRRTQEYYDSLPESSRAAIVKRTERLQLGS